MLSYAVPCYAMLYEIVPNRAMLCYAECAGDLVEMLNICCECHD